ncbi:hypothetical protein JXB37_03925 [candidate division WOR-3 bacterium]|nr:hypothetical protein [candidate division WOR-3 bacterium]
MRGRKQTESQPRPPASAPAPAAQSRTRLLLVDYENVQQVELGRLDESYRAIIFVGQSQKNIPLELVTAAQKMGSRVEWHKVSGDGRNALDFVIACHLGRVYERAPRPECIVLSHDKGFDPLLKYLNAAGMKCRRVNSVLELSATATAAEEPNIKRVVEVLGRSEKRSRPRKRKTLAQAIAAMFQKQLSRQDIDHIIDALMAKKLVAESNGIITYEF